MKLDNMILMTVEMACMLVLFIVGMVVQFLINKAKKPYVVRNVNEPYLARVFIYRIVKHGSRYIEYTFTNADGGWKPVIEKRSIIGYTVMALIMSGIVIYLSGIEGLLCMGMPVALFAVALTVARYVEAYIILMKN